ncbi:MAG: hypothetical protein JO061_20560 [Acidobacteriaceae bacterium]|nr:hypothetical protein [Acidobacteriaceae bacterium]
MASPRVVAPVDMNQAAKTTRWKVIQEIFEGALERNASERSEYVANACGRDEELRAEVESLLASDSDAGTVLHSLIASDIRDLEQTSQPSQIGLELGPYRLLREIDSGGMGIVYLAVRSDDQYFQIVAIKMIRKGLESPALIQRFRAERQILANLNHPNIDAELAVNDVPKAQQYTNLSLPFLNTFPLTSPDLRILRDVGLCYETLGNVQTRIAMNHSVSLADRQTARLAARGWYLKSAIVWNEWNKRGAATPESELERHKVERLLGN